MMVDEGKCWKTMAKALLEPNAGRTRRELDVEKGVLEEGVVALGRVSSGGMAGSPFASAWALDMAPIAEEVADSVLRIDMGSTEPAAEDEARACRDHFAPAFHLGTGLLVAPVA